MVSGRFCLGNHHPSLARCTHVLRLATAVAVAILLVDVLPQAVIVAHAVSLPCDPATIQVVKAQPYGDDSSSDPFVLIGCRGHKAQSLDVYMQGGASLYVTVTDSWLGTVRIFPAKTGSTVQIFFFTVSHSTWAPSATQQPALEYNTTLGVTPRQVIEIANTSMVVVQAPAIYAHATTLQSSTVTVRDTTMRSTGWTNLIDLRALTAQSSLAMIDVTIQSDLGASNGNSAHVIYIRSMDASTLTLSNCNTTIAASNVEGAVGVHAISVGLAGGGRFEMTSGTWRMAVDQVVYPGTLTMVALTGLVDVAVRIAQASFLLHHNVYGDFTTTWTSASIWDVRCSSCPTYAIANNTIHAGATFTRPPSSNSYYYRTYAAVVVLSGTLTSSVAAVSDNNVTVRLTSPSTESRSGEALFTIFAPAIRSGTSLSISRNVVEAYHDAAPNNVPTFYLLFANPISMHTGASSAIEGNLVNVLLRHDDDKTSSSTSSSSSVQKRVEIIFLAPQPASDASVVIARNRINANPASDSDGDEATATAQQPAAIAQRCATDYNGFDHRICGNVINVWSYGTTASLLGSTASSVTSHMYVGMVVEHNILTMLSSSASSGGEGSSSSSASSSSSYYDGYWDSASAKLIDRVDFHGGIVQHNVVVISGFAYVDACLVSNAKWYQNFSSAPPASDSGGRSAPTRVWNNSIDVTEARSYVNVYMLQSLSLYPGAFAEAYGNVLRVAPRNVSEEYDDDYYYYEVYGEMVSNTNLYPDSSSGGDDGTQRIRLYVTNNIMEARASNYSSSPFYAYAASSIKDRSDGSALVVVAVVSNSVVVRGTAAGDDDDASVVGPQERLAGVQCVDDGPLTASASVLVCNNTIFAFGRGATVELSTTFCYWCAPGTGNGSILIVRGNVVDVVSAAYVDVSWCSGCLSSMGAANITGNLAYLTDVGRVFAVAGAYAGAITSPVEPAGGVDTFLVAQNSVEGFASWQHSMPPVGERLPSTTGYDQNCHQLGTTNALVRAWWSPGSSSPSSSSVSVVCDNHIYAMDTRDTLSATLLSYASLQVSSTITGTESAVLFVVDNLIRVTGGAPTVSVVWCGGAHFSSQSTMVASQTALLWALVVASNTAMLSNIASVTGALFSVSISQSAERPAVTHFIRGNRVLVVGTPAFPAAELQSLQSSAAASCPLITTTTRSVQCNNTVVAWNVSASGSLTLVAQATMSGSYNTVLQNSDTILVANNTVMLLHLQLADVGIANSVQLRLHNGYIEIADNVALIENASSMVSVYVARYLYPYVAVATFLAGNTIDINAPVSPPPGGQQEHGGLCYANALSASPRSLIRVVRNVVEGRNISTSAAVTVNLCQSIYTYLYGSAGLYATTASVCANAVSIGGGVGVGPLGGSVAITFVGTMTTSRSSFTISVTANNVVVDAGSGIGSGAFEPLSSTSLSIVLVNSVQLRHSSSTLKGPMLAAVTNNKISVVGALLPTRVLVSFVNELTATFATNAGTLSTLVVASNNVSIGGEIDATTATAPQQETQQLQGSTVGVSVTAVGSATATQTTGLVGIGVQLSIQTNAFSIRSVHISDVAATVVGTVTLSTVSSDLVVEGNALHVMCTSSASSVRIVGVSSFATRTSSLSLRFNSIIVNTSMMPPTSLQSATTIGDAPTVSIAFCTGAALLSPQISSTAEILFVSMQDNTVNVGVVAPRVAAAFANAPANPSTVDMCVGCSVSAYTSLSPSSPSKPTVAVEHNAIYIALTIAEPRSSNDTYVGSPLLSVSLCRSCSLLTPSSASRPAAVSLSFNTIHVEGGGALVSPTVSTQPAPSTTAPTSPPDDDDDDGDGAGEATPNTAESAAADHDGVVNFRGARLSVSLCDACTLAYNHSLLCASNEIQAAHCSSVVASLVDVGVVVPSASSLPIHNVSAVVGFDINVTRNSIAAVDTDSTTVVLMGLPWRVPPTTVGTGAVAFRVAVDQNSVRVKATALYRAAATAPTSASQDGRFWTMNVTLASVLGALYASSTLDVSSNQVIATASAQSAVTARVVGALMRIDGTESQQANDILCCVVSNHDGDDAAAVGTMPASSDAMSCASSSSKAPPGSSSSTVFVARIVNTTLRSSRSGGEGSNNISNNNETTTSESATSGGGLAFLTIATSAQMPVPPHHAHNLTIVAASNHMASQWAAASPRPQLVKASIGSDTYGCVVSCTANHAPYFGLNVTTAYRRPSSNSSNAAMPLRQSTEVVVDSSVVGAIYLGGSHDLLAATADVGHAIRLNVSASSVRGGVVLFGNLDRTHVDVRNDSRLTSPEATASGGSCAPAAAVTVAPSAVATNVTVRITNTSFGDAAAAVQQAGTGSSGPCATSSGGVLAVWSNATLRGATLSVVACSGVLRSGRSSSIGGGGGVGVLQHIDGANVMENVTMVVTRVSFTAVVAHDSVSSGDRNHAAPSLVLFAHRRQLLHAVLNVSASTIVVAYSNTSGGVGTAASSSSQFLLPVVAFGPSVGAETYNVRVLLDNTTLVGYTYVAQWMPTTAAMVQQQDLSATLRNTTVASACIRWGADRRDVAPRSATPGAWRSIYEPLCTSAYLDGATCPCIVPFSPSASQSISPSISSGSQSVSQSASVSVSRTPTGATGSMNYSITMVPTRSQTVVYGALPPCPALAATPGVLNAAAIQQGAGTLTFSMLPSSTTATTTVLPWNRFSMPVRAVLPTIYLQWSVLPTTSAAAGGGSSVVAQPGGFGSVDGAAIVCEVVTAWAINCSLPTAAGVDPLIPETVGLRLRANVYAFRCDDSSLSAATFVLDPAAPSAMQEAVQVVSGIAAAAGFGSSFAGAPDGQVLASLTGMSCASTVSQEASGPLQYLVSPFYDLGPVAVVLGNMALSIGVFGLRWLLVTYAPGNHRLFKPRVMRFPSLDFTVACFFSQGVVGFGGKLLFAIPSPGGGILGLLAVGYTVALYGLGLRQSLALRSMLTVQPYTLTSAVQRWCLPNGYWRPRRLVRTYGAFFAKTNATPAAPFALFAAAAGCLTTLLAAIAPPKAGCVAQLVCIALLLAASGVVVAVRRPLRIPATHIFSVTSYANMSFLMVLYAVGIDHPSVSLEVVKGYVTLMQTFLVVARSVHDVSAKVVEIFSLRKQVIDDDDDGQGDGGGGDGGLIDLAIGLLDGGDTGHQTNGNCRKGGDNDKVVNVEMLPIVVEQDDDSITLSDDDDNTVVNVAARDVYASVDGRVDDDSLADSAAASLRRRALEMEAQHDDDEDDDDAAAYGGLLGVSLARTRPAGDRPPANLQHRRDQEPRSDGNQEVDEDDICNALPRDDGDGIDSTLSRATRALTMTPPPPLTHCDQPPKLEAPPPPPPPPPLEEEEDAEDPFQDESAALGVGENGSSSSTDPVAKAMLLDAEIGDDALQIDRECAL